MPDKQPDTLESLRETVRTMQQQYEEVCEHRKELAERPSRSFKVDDVLRMRQDDTGRFRVWIVTSVNLGGLNQEGTYSLFALDILDNEPIKVPCIILESNREVELMSCPCE